MQPHRLQRSLIRPHRPAVNHVARRTEVSATATMSVCGGGGHSRVNKWHAFHRRSSSPLTVTGDEVQCQTQEEEEEEEDGSSQPCRFANVGVRGNKEFGKEREKKKQQTRLTEEKEIAQPETIQPVKKRVKREREGGGVTITLFCVVVFFCAPCVRLRAASVVPIILFNTILLPRNKNPEEIQPSTFSFRTLHAQ